MDNSDLSSCNGVCCCNAANDDDDDGGGKQPHHDQSLWKPWPAEALSMAKIAFELTQQEWSQTGLGIMRLRIVEAKTKIASSALQEDEDDDERILKSIIDRIVALLLIRIVALVASRLGNGRRTIADDTYNHICVDKNSNCTCRGRRREKIYPDYSTTTICKTALQLSLDDLDLVACCDKEIPSVRNTSHSSTSLSNLYKYPNNNNNIDTFPSQITPTVINQLQQYVTVICRQYPPTKDVPYHNVEHAYHVFISANKLLDLLLCEEEQTTTTTRTTSNNDSSPRHRPTFGLKYDTLSQLAFLFSALVHDVDHKGISNRQLVLEQDDLAILYNDQSVAEQRSLAVAFTTLKGVEYDMMREVLFPTRDTHSILTPPPTPPITDVKENSTGVSSTTAAATVALPRDMKNASLGNNEDFLRFRKLVIDLVLVTDIASPERTQIVKSKWKEAFGGVVVAEKLRKRASASSAAAAAVTTNLIGGSICEIAADRKCLETTTGGGTSNGAYARLESQTSSKYGSDIYGLNNRHRSSFSDRQQSTAISLEHHQQSTQAQFIPSMDFSNKQPHQEVAMPQNVNFFLGDSISSSTSSPSLSTIQSNEEDDFDASAVSRSKMNFNNDEKPSPSRSYDSMENLLEAAANYNLDGSDEALGDDEGGNITRNYNLRYHDGSKPAKRSSHQHEKHQDEDDDTLDRDHDSEVLRWSTGDLSSNDNQQHHQRRMHPSPMRLSHSVKTPHEMRYMPRRLHKLGVRRALDLAGSTITAYSYNAVSSSSSLRGGASSSAESREMHPSEQRAEHKRNVDDDIDLNDDVDEFKATVVLEQMMHAADVAALFQDWENVVEWSTRLYKELNNGYLSNRGDDPSLEWYENQMKFFDFYILPLAKNLAVMGVFDEGVGERFVHGVKSNMARWIREGSRAAQKMKEDEEVRLRRY